MLLGFYKLVAVMTPRNVCITSGAATVNPRGTRAAHGCVDISDSLKEDENHHLEDNDTPVWGQDWYG